MLPKKNYSSLRNDFHYPYIIAQPPLNVIRFSEDFLYKFLYVLKRAIIALDKIALSNSVRRQMMRARIML